MSNKINLKTKSLYIGVYNDEDDSHTSWIHFAYSSSASDAELDKHFRKIFFCEYGTKMDKNARVDVYELTGALDYSTGKHKKNYKIILS